MTPPLPLEEIAQRIQKQQAELAALRRDYQARQARLAKLNRRKQQLQAELNRVERDITAATGGPAPTPAPAPAAPKKPAAAPTKVQPAPAPSLTDFLVTQVRQAKGAVTVKALVEAVTRQKIPTQSRNLPELVKSRVQDLVGRGVLRRAKDQPGVVIAEAAAVAKPSPRSGGTKAGARAAPAKPHGKQPPAKPRREQPALKEVLVQLLQKSQRPLRSGELAEQAKAAGVRSQSKDFTNLVAVTLHKLANVQRIPGQGYRLKK